VLVDGAVAFTVVSADCTFFQPPGISFTAGEKTIDLIEADAVVSLWRSRPSSRPGRVVLRWCVPELMSIVRVTGFSHLIDGGLEVSVDDERGLYVDAGNFGCLDWPLVVTKTAVGQSLEPLQTLARWLESIADHGVARQTISFPPLSELAIPNWLVRLSTRRWDIRYSAHDLEGYWEKWVDGGR
jgi:hypothetical protein